MSLSATVLGGIATFRYHWDRHVYDIESHDLEIGAHFQSSAYIIVSLGTIALRISIMFFYKAVVVNASRIHRKIWFGLFSFILIIGSGIVALALFIAIEGNRKGESTATATFVALGTLCDFAVTILPIDLVWKLHLPRKERLVLISFFALGLVVCLAGIARTAAVIKSSSDDTTYWVYLLWFLGLFELNAGIVC
jgi:hypothetical protein